MAVIDDINAYLEAIGDLLVEHLASRLPGFTPEQVEDANRCLAQINRDEDALSFWIDRLLRIGDQ